MQAPLNGNRPPQTPEFSASATLGWVPAADWRLAATLRHVGAQFEGDQEDGVLPAATTLDRLESKGFVRFELGESTPERGGRARKYFSVEPAGREALAATRQALSVMWDGVSI